MCWTRRTGLGSTRLVPSPWSASWMTSRGHSSPSGLDIRICGGRKRDARLPKQVCLVAGACCAQFCVFLLRSQELCYLSLPSCGHGTFHVYTSINVSFWWPPLGPGPSRLSWRAIWSPAWSGLHQIACRDGPSLSFEFRERRGSAMCCGSRCQAHAKLVHAPRNVETSSGLALPLPWASLRYAAAKPRQGTRVSTGTWRARWNRFLDPAHSKEWSWRFPVESTLAGGCFTSAELSERGLMSKGPQIALLGPSHHKHHLELCGTHCLGRAHRGWELRTQLSCSLPTTIVPTRAAL